MIIPGGFANSRTPEKIMAAKPYVGKSVYFIDNVMPNATVDGIIRHVMSLGVTVLSCHSVQPRRSRWQSLNGIVPTDRSTFRLCIPREQSDKLLIADAWPAKITIAAWRFIQKRGSEADIQHSSALQRTSIQQQRSSVSALASDTSLPVSNIICDPASDHRSAVIANTTTTAAHHRQRSSAALL